MKDSIVKLFNRGETHFKRDDTTREYFISIHDGLELPRVISYSTLTDMLNDASRLEITLSGNITKGVQEWVSSIMCYECKFPLSVVINNTTTKVIELEGLAHSITIKGSSVSYLEIAGYVKYMNVLKGSYVENLITTTSSRGRDFYLVLDRSIVANSDIVHDGTVNIDMNESHVWTYGGEPVYSEYVGGKPAYLFNIIDLVTHPLFSCSIADYKEVVLELTKTMEVRIDE